MTIETPSRELLVVKIGTDTVTNGNGLDQAVLRHVTGDIADLIREGIRVVLVSSGAVGAGIPGHATAEQRAILRTMKPTVSTLGQHKLMAAFGYHFDNHGIEVAQWLTEPHNFASAESQETMLGNFGNLGALEEVYGRPIVPILNTNDFVTRAGFETDNDRLAGFAVRVFPGVRKRLLLLTNKPGLLRDVHDDTSVVREVRAGDNWRQYIHEKKSENGTGNMLSKCEVAEEVALEDILAAIGNGKTRGAIRKLLSGEGGTRFLPPGYTEHL
ncbi:hypothetical protein A2454_04830 [Candidatus Peribacteria bacterium RIFOXYC2_FULL_55_14]|nr:MAG: Glutamate 5-kinase [Candidatus Peribacteria bacterium GW2011_GWB1_54_5]KKW41244.1 MAG: Glutamate 5-kinase [Candidatus Peribacteria bacterium GW2011_GWC2_54_8]KKW43375.1 MAG: Glutamate 5-kinase [Candidatus Peregrinibacteria bacterium GW2011_GWA2_54_9]OGJ71330.1 MAG: hypothetical protein A2198_06015 [Candidatus Peribacteria bacterium RIFOXYA1_FULL_56_14]OGJ74327.1 MAG: hypothetical protein A2384_06390 [Candidatus Peribacteria bacterium RIFOXYB1_FULL_54_35]OGJ75138.1 MAG: hypothetical pro